MADILFPPIPQPDKDGNVNAKDLAAYNKNMQEVIKRYIGSFSSDGESSDSTVDSFEIIDGYMYVRDEKASGAEGGTSSSETWHDRTLNVEVVNSILNASLSSNKVTLPAGKYRIRGHAPAYKANRHKLKLYDYTNSSDLLIGSSCYAYATNSIDNNVFVEGEINLDDVTEIGLKHYTTIGLTSFGLGVSGRAGVIEVYATLEIWKIRDVNLTETSVLANIGNLATTSEAQAGTDDVKYLSPLKLRKGLNADGSAPVYACRAWVNFDGTANVSGASPAQNVIRGSGNVSSITDNGTGDYTINFITPMEDANYSVVTQCESIGATNVSLSQVISYLTTSVTINTVYVSSASNRTLVDLSYINVAVFR